MIDHSVLEAAKAAYVEHDPSHDVVQRGRVAMRRAGLSDDVETWRWLSDEPLGFLDRIGPMLLGGGVGAVRMTAQAMFNVGLVVGIHAERERVKAMSSLRLKVLEIARDAAHARARADELEREHGPGSELVEHSRKLADLLTSFARAASDSVERLDVVGGDGRG